MSIEFSYKGFESVVIFSSSYHLKIEMLKVELKQDSHEIGKKQINLNFIILIRRHKLLKELKRRKKL